MTNAAKDLAPSAPAESRSAAREADQRAAALEALVDRIGEDARRDPRGYLRDTVVPEGGE